MGFFELLFSGLVLLWHLFMIVGIITIIIVITVESKSLFFEVISEWFK